MPSLKANKHRVLHVNSSYCIAVVNRVTYQHMQCNNTCGRGVQKRNVRCRRNSDNKAAPGYCCQEKPLPQLQRDCYDDRASWCRPQWHAGSWEQVGGNPITPTYLKLSPEDDNCRINKIAACCTLLHYAFLVCTNHE